MEIYLKKGIGELKFGMTTSDVKESLGQPDRIKVHPDDANDLIWEFNNLKLRLTFYQNESGRLGYLHCSNAELTYNGSPVIDQPVETALNRIFTDLGLWQKEEYDLFTTYFNEAHWLTLNVEFERITDIELGIPFRSEEEYDWPED